MEEIYEALLARNNIFAIVFDVELKVVLHTLPITAPGTKLSDFRAYLGTEVLNRIELLIGMEWQAEGKKISLDGLALSGPSVHVTLFRIAEKDLYALQISPLPAERSVQLDREDLWQRTSERLEDVQRILGTLDELRRLDGRLNDNAVARDIRDRYLPELRELKDSISDPVLGLSLDIIEKNLAEILSPDDAGLPKALYAKLTPSEIQIAEFIRMGKSSKDIADALDIAAKTVENHRNNLREKLGLKNRGVNLRSYLLQLGEESS